MAVEAARPRFDPIHQLRAHEYVADQLRRHIALRLIPPGETLPSERDLASMFGVGRPTIQHALRLLEADRLVEARRGRRGGTFVLQPAEDTAAMEELIARVVRQSSELEELLVYRRTLEPPSAGVAAESHDAQDLVAMRGALRAMDLTSTEPEYMRHDTDFHLCLARATHNGFLAREIEEIRTRLNDAMSLLPESDTWHRRISGEHEAVLAAVEASDPRGAQEAMAVHVTHSDQSLRALLAAMSRRKTR